MLGAAQCSVEEAENVSSEGLLLFRSFFGLFLLSEEYYIMKEGLEKKIMCFKNSGENSHFILVF